MPKALTAITLAHSTIESLNYSHLSKRPQVFRDTDVTTLQLSVSQRKKTFYVDLGRIKDRRYRRSIGEYGKMYSNRAREIARALMAAKSKPRATTVTVDAVLDKMLTDDTKHRGLFANIVQKKTPKRKPQALIIAQKKLQNIRSIMQKVRNTYLQDRMQGSDGTIRLTGSEYSTLLRILEIDDAV